MNELKRIATYSDFLGELTATYRRTSKPTKKIKSSIDINDFIRPYFDECMDDHEELKVIHLNRSNCIVNVHHHSVGGMSSTLVDFPLIFRQALLIRTESIVMVHNHPTGNLSPSEADKKTAERLKEACHIIGISLLDNLIITRESYFSFVDEGLL